VISLVQGLTNIYSQITLVEPPVPLLCKLLSQEELISATLHANQPGLFILMDRVETLVICLINITRDGVAISVIMSVLELQHFITMALAYLLACIPLSPTPSTARSIVRFHATEPVTSTSIIIKLVTSTAQLL
jgi:hypothetical protein